MRKQFLIVSTAFGLGALLGWGITADLKDLQGRRNRDAFRKLINSQSELIDHLYDGVNPLMPDEHEVMLDRGPAPVRKITLGELRSLSLDKEPNVYDESVHVVPTPAPVEDDRSEAQFLSERMAAPTEEEAVVGTENAPEESVVEHSEDENSFPAGETPEETKANLQNLINQYTQNPEDRDAFVDLASQPTIPGYTPPYVITKGKYSWDPDLGDSFRKVTINFYPNDRVLLDEDEDVIENIERTVGWRSLAQFGFESDDPDIVYIRNEELETDFEVIKESDPLPLHVKYGMSKDEYIVNKAAGKIRFRQEDRD